MIPPMTDALGKYWTQPKTEDLLLSNGKVYLTRPTWEQLADYSASRPSGVYPGKMWRNKWNQLLYYDHSTQLNTCVVIALDAVVCESLRREDGRVCLLKDVPYPNPPWTLCDSYYTKAALCDETITCLACIANGGKGRSSGLRCSLCDAFVGACPHTKRTP